MKAPQNLRHRPIVSVNDYDKIDAQYRNNTDVRALSIGRAQYDDENQEISLKVWRHTGVRWSRQSEEIPIHRNIDLNILLLGALMTDINSGYPATNLREEIENEAEFGMITEYYSNNENFLRPRLEELRDKLNEFLDS
ncbi:MAG: DUF6530 family protein [Putridiphycobacter sp.]